MAGIFSLIGALGTTTKAVAVASVVAVGGGGAAMAATVEASEPVSVVSEAPAETVDPIEPAPVEPAPEDPAPVEPAPEEPAPVDPAPVEPAPEDPAPVEPAPEEPAPVEPAPVEPAPVDPAPVVPVTPGNSAWAHENAAAKRAAGQANAAEHRSAHAATPATPSYGGGASVKAVPAPKAENPGKANKNK